VEFYDLKELRVQENLSLVPCVFDIYVNRWNLTATFILCFHLFNFTLFYLQILIL